VGALAVVVVAPRAVHGAALTVLTGSMTPEIPVGSVVIVRPVDPRVLRPGDVATYQPKKGEDAYITHRIIEVHDDPEGLTFTFKGDANRGADLNPIPAGAVRGEVWFHVPYLGAIRDALHGKGGISLVAMLALAAYALSQLSGGLRERKAGRGEKPGPATASRLTIERTLILVELEHAAGGTIDPQALARQWAGLVLGANESSVTLLLAPPPQGVAAAVELLTEQDPLRLQVWESPSVLLGTDGSPASTAKEVSTHAAP
jgi:signal peptidase